MKIARGKIFALLAVIPVLEGALFGYLYLGESREQDRLQAELDASTPLLGALPTTDYQLEMETRENNLEAAINDADVIKQQLAVALEPAGIYRDLFDVAGVTGVSVTSINSPGESVHTINKYDFTVLSLNLSVSGTAECINNYAAAVSDKFPTAAINSIRMSTHEVYGEQETSAEINMGISSIRGGTYE